MRFAILTLLIAACSSPEPRPPSVPPRVAPVIATLDAPPPARDDRRAVVLVTDPAALAAIAGAGGSFDAMTDDRDRATVFAAVRADVATAARGDRDAGVGIAGHDHRLFDVGWLDRGSFALIGLAYRVDRIPVTPASCGDVRLIYRLAYRATSAGVEVASRLPMTVALVLDGPARDGSPSGCRAAAQAWRLDPALAGDALGRALVAGPLATSLARARVHQVLTNAQVVRWPSAARPDLAGHAEYALRQFGRDGELLVADVVDQTPDVAAIAADRGKRAQLLAWLRDPATLAALALGWARLPAVLSASRALSVSPRGLARRANRPFRQLLSPRDVADLPALGSPEALLRRLDDHTCAGCHQSQTIAGFHLLGDDGDDVAPGNALAVAISPPLVADRVRRAALVEALAAGTAVDFTRPVFERAGNLGGRGARCGLGDPGFAAWTCQPDLTCQPTDGPRDDDAVGECLPSIDRRDIGDPCELGPLVASADPRRDQGPRARVTSCGDGVCDVDRVGFPGGMCTNACSALTPIATCGVIADLTPFNNCLARGRPFPECLTAHVNPAGLRRCDAATPCRDDYVCARGPTGVGGCTPPYFLFQLRVDGHPLTGRR